MFRTYIDGFRTQFTIIILETDKCRVQFTILIIFYLFTVDAIYNQFELHIQNYLKCTKL